jgi:DNA polymerase-1
MKLVFDIETDGLLYPTRASSTSPVKPPMTRIWCMVIKELGTGRVARIRPHQLAKGFEILKKADLLIGHNILEFDVPALRRFFGELQVPMYDTLICSRMIFGPPENTRQFPLKDSLGRGAHSLEAWGIKLGFPKGNHEDWTQFSEEMLKYNENDVLLSEKVYLKIQDLLKTRQHLVKPIEIEFQVQDICSRMSENGFAFDAVGAENLLASLSIEKAAASDELRRVFPPIVQERVSEKTGKTLKPKIIEFNPGSSLMIAARLKEKYNWKAPRTTAGSPSITSEILEELDFPEAKLLATYKEIEKVSGYLEDWLARVPFSAGRIHPRFNPLGTATGRMSCSQPNLQQVPKDGRIRSLFVADPGWVLIGVDAAGLEGRMAAHETTKLDGGKFRDELLHGDMHTTTWKENEDLGCTSRNMAKPLFYGALLYGASDKKTGSIVKRGEAEGKAIKERYFKRVPVIPKIQELAEYELSSSKWILLIDGRLVRPPLEKNRWTGKLVRPLRKALNYKLQGNGAMVMKYALVIMYNRLKQEVRQDMWKLLAIVHDEFQLTAHESVAQRVKEIAEESIFQAGEQLGFLCPQKGEGKIGKTWKDTH